MPALVVQMFVVGFFSSLLLTLCTADDLTVQLPDGKIQGRTLKSLNDNDYYSFQGIPYAAPPIGENRFKEPKDPEPWSGVRDATDSRKVCLQSADWNAGDVTMNKTEDCLYLDVFSPVKPGSTDLRPVLVYIHGGGYIGGSGTFYSTGPKYFMDYGIVIVGINYRLGPTGFLTTMDGVIPGNLGLKDQRQALRWLQKNIQFLGGDPKKVTISGESAGAFSVAFQLLSLNAEGLFRGVIQESGTSMSTSAYTDKARSFAYQFANNLDKTFTEKNTTTELLNVVLKATSDDLLNAGENMADPGFSPLGYNHYPVWGAVLENRNDSNDPFVTAPMYESFLNGDFHNVSILLGFNSEEAMFFSRGRGCTFGKSYDEDPTLMISDRFNIPKEDYEVVAAELKKIYSNTSFEETLGDCIKYDSAVVMMNPITRQAEITSKYVPVYLYQFAYAGVLGTPPNGRTYIPGTEQVGHAEELKYLWEFGYGGDITPDDLLAMKRLHTLWSNFVKFLNPTPEPDELLNNAIWTTVVAGDHIQYLNINKTVEMRDNPRYYQKVKQVLVKYQQPPFVTW